MVGTAREERAFAHPTQLKTWMPGTSPGMTEKENAAMKTGQFDLKGKVAVVTGGNGGIGLGLARGLADAGADIAVVGRNEAKSAAAVDDLRKRGVRAIAVATDVTDKAAVAAMIERVGKELGRI